jgi:hypothetical protein
VGSGTLKRPSVFIVDVRRPVQADCDRNVVSFEAVQPVIIDQHAIRRHSNGYFTARSRRNGRASLSDPMKILDSPKQGLATVQNDWKIDERVPGDVLFYALQQLLQHISAHQLRFVVNRSVTEPVAVGTVDVAARCDFDKQLRDRVALENNGIQGVNRHTNTRKVRGN